MVKTLIKNITYYVGAFAMFLSGIAFLLMSDLIFSNTSDRLIIAVLLSFGGAISFFFSMNFVEKPKIMFTLKGIGLGLTAGFLVYIHLFANGEFYLAALDSFNAASKFSDIAASKATIILTLVLGYIGIVGQAANTVLSILVKEDDDIVPAREPAEDPASNSAEAPAEVSQEESAPAADKE